MRILPFFLLLAAALPGAAAPARAQENIDICANQPVPATYAVVAVGKGAQCPGYYGSASNVITIRVPGDTISVCTAYTSEVIGYVLTARTRRPACPGYYGSASNSATWRRLASAPAPQPQAEIETLDAWDEHSAYAMQGLREVEEQMGLDVPTHRTFISATAPRATTRATLRLLMGRRYTVVGACDSDCGALTIRVLDPRGYPSAQSDPVPLPVVHLAPIAEGDWTLEVSATECAAQFCRLAVGVYVQPDVANAPPATNAPPARPQPRPRRRPQPRS